MKVFISWSGKRSKALAVALREWLPLVLQYVEPWVSEKDIAAGDRWALAIAGELETSNFGIICVTPENLNSQWVLFEAGALSKSMQDAKVIPLLFGLENSDVTGPLAQFQAQKVDQSGMTEVIQAINSVPENKASSEIITQLVPAVWPKLESAIAKIPDKGPSEKHMRPHHEILEELVTGVRSINSQMREFDPEMSERGSRHARFRKSRFQPRLINEMIHISGKENGATPLLLLAGLFREDFPWLAEVLLEAYRAVRDGDHKSFMQLRRSIKLLMHSPFIVEMLAESKEHHMMAMEASRMIERVIERHLNITERPLEDDVEFDNE